MILKYVQQGCSKLCLRGMCALEWMTIFLNREGSLKGGGGSMRKVRWNPVCGSEVRLTSFL